MYDHDKETPATELIDFSLEIGSLELIPEGRALKSGRISPHFFNAGLFTTGKALKKLAAAYADKMLNISEDINVVFGPSYKGTLIVGPIVEKMSEDYRYQNTRYSSNRKEAKDHGEGGIIIGAPLKGKRVVIVDDVMTTGGSCAEAVEIIRAQGGTPIGCIIAFDRQERGRDENGNDTELSATQEFTKKFGIPVLAAATLTDLITCLRRKPTESGDDSAGEILEKILAYQKQYGVAA